MLGEKGYFAEKVQRPMSVLTATGKVQINETHEFSATTRKNASGSIASLILLKTRMSI